jgi:hypothetical protein
VPIRGFNHARRRCMAWNPIAPASQLPCYEGSSLRAFGFAPARSQRTTSGSASASRRSLLLCAKGSSATKDDREARVPSIHARAPASKNTDV